MLELGGIEFYDFSSYFHKKRVNIKSKSQGLSLVELSRSAGWSTCNSFACFNDTITVDSKSSNVMLSEL